jgi:hypothetical protein
MTSVALGHHPRRHVDAFFDALVRELLPVTREVAACAATASAATDRRNAPVPAATTRWET